MKKLIIAILLSLFTIVTIDLSASENEIFFDFESAKNNAITSLVGYDFMDSTIQEKIDSHDNKISNIDGTGIYDTIEYDKTFLWNEFSDLTDSKNITSTFKNIHAMSISYRTYNSKFYLDPSLLNAIEYSLEFMTEYYNITIARPGNWWDYEIGTPQKLAEILILMDGHIDPNLVTIYTQTIDDFIPDPNYRLNGVYETGANLLDKCYITMLNNIIKKDFVGLKFAIDSSDRAFYFVDEGDGFYEDGSFIQHQNIAYTGSYGEVLLKKAANIVFVLSDNMSLFATNEINNMPNLFLNNFYPVMYKGAVYDMTMGRSLSRLNVTNQSVGKAIIQDSIVLSNGFDTPESDFIKSISKGMINERGSNEEYYEGLSIFNYQMAKQLLEDTSITPKYEERSGSKNLGAMAQYVNLNRGFSTTIGGYRTNISAFENGNNENLKGFFDNVGTMRIYNDDLTHYDTSYYATLDRAFVPGTSSNGKLGVLKPDWSDYLNTSNIANGVENPANGLYSIDVDLSGVTGDETRYRRTFIFSDNIIIVLTSDISSTNPVYTTVDDRVLPNGDMIYVNDIPYTGDFEINNVGENKVYMPGISQNTGISYYIPESDVSVKSDTITSNISEINAGYNMYFTDTHKSIIINQSTSNFNNFEYIIMPNTSKNELDNYIRDYEIIENSDTAHIVERNGVRYTSIFESNGSSIYENNSPISFITTTLSPDVYNISIASLDLTNTTKNVSIVGQFELMDGYSFVESTYDAETNRTSFNYVPTKGHGSTDTFNVRKIS